ncbi:pyridoxamine 5'-phosphate oxidase family protein [Thermodesulfobacteriota bacterium]
MDRKEVMEFFNKRPRNCFISTANSKGDVNVAVYGSPQMIDENTVIFGIGNKRSYQYLRENSKAAIIVTEPGEITHDSIAVRLYLDVVSIDTEGDLYEEVKAGVAKRAGKEAADGFQAAIRLKITEVRPLIAPPIN